MVEKRKVLPLISLYDDAFRVTELQHAFARAMANAGPGITKEQMIDLYIQISGSQSRKSALNQCYNLLNKEKVKNLIAAYRKVADPASRDRLLAEREIITEKLLDAFEKGEVAGRDVLKALGDRDKAYGIAQPEVAVSKTEDNRRVVLQIFGSEETAAKSMNAAKKFLTGGEV